MTVQYRPFSDWLSNEKLVDKLFLNIVNTISYCKPTSINQLSEKDINSLKRFVDQVMGQAVSVLLDYYDDDDDYNYEAIIADFARSINIDTPGLEVSENRPLGISSVISIFCLNNVISQTSGDLVFNMSMTDVIFNDIGAVTNLMVYLKEHNVKLIPKSIDHLTLSWLSYVPGVMDRMGDNNVPIPKNLDDVYHHQCRIKSERYYDDHASSIIDDVANAIVHNDTEAFSGMHDVVDVSQLYNDDTDLLDLTPVNNIPEKTNNESLRYQQSALASLFKRESLVNSPVFNSDDHLEGFLKSFEVDANFVSSIKRNSTVLVLGLRNLLSDYDDDESKLLLEEILKKIVEFDSTDENVINSILLVGAFEAAFRSSIQSSQAQLEKIPEKILSDVSTQISNVADEAGAKTKSLLDSMTTVMNQTEEWGKKLTSVVENYNSAIEMMPELLSEKFDQSMRAESQDLFKKALAMISVNDKKTLQLGDDILLAKKEIKSLSDTAFRRTLMIILIAVPILVVGVNFLLQFFMSH